MAKTRSNTTPDFADAQPLGAQDVLAGLIGNSSAGKSAHGTSNPGPSSSSGMLSLEDFMGQVTGNGSMGFEADPAEAARQQFDDVLARAKAMDPKPGSQTGADPTENQDDVPAGYFDPLAEEMHTDNARRIARQAL